MWPSEIAQDCVRGYDFMAQAPKESYQDMLWEIAQYVPVVTGPWEAATLPGTGDLVQQMHGNDADATAALPIGHVSSDLFSESDVDEQGTSLWELFFDSNRGEYRQYHRLSKRVRPVPAENDSSVSSVVSEVACDSESDAQLRGAT